MGWVTLSTCRGGEVSRVSSLVQGESPGFQHGLGGGSLVFQHGYEKGHLCVSTCAGEGNPCFGMVPIRPPRFIYITATRVFRTEVVFRWGGGIF